MASSRVRIRAQRDQIWRAGCLDKAFLFRTRLRFIWPHFGKFYAYAHNYLGHIYLQQMAILLSCILNQPKKLLIHICHWFDSCISCLTSDHLIIKNTALHITSLYRPFVFFSCICVNRFHKRKFTLFCPSDPDYIDWNGDCACQWEVTSLTPSVDGCRAT